MARTGVQMRQGLGMGLENGGAGSSNGSVNGSQQQQQSVTSQYTLPGVLHYLNYEHRRFETQRNYWEIERAELKVKW